MDELGSLGKFLILALISPGVVILAAISLLFPEFSSLLQETTPYQALGAVLFTSITTAMTGFFIEKSLLHRIWLRIYPDWESLKKETLISERYRILGQAEVKKIPHDLIDQLLGEHALYTNVSIWLVIVSIVRLLIDCSNKWLYVFAGVLLVVSIVNLFSISPYFKKSYIDALDVVDQELRHIND